MLVLSYPKKNILFLLAVTIAACLLAPGAAKAQAQSAIINPDGGNTPTDGLRITITDTAILVKRNGLEQYNLSDTIPPHDRGLKTYVILQQKSGTNTIKQPTYLTACDISGVHGEGTIADPWKVTTLTTLNNATGGIYNLTTVYSYVNGNDYYLVDFYISAHERFLTASGTGGPYYMHIYFSERSWLNNSDIAGAVADDWVSCETDDYFDDEWDFTLVPSWNQPQLVGAECGSGDCPDGFTGGHYFKTKGGFTSYKGGAPQGRDTKVTPGYELESQITSVIQSMGVAVHKTVEIEASNAGKTRSATKRFIIGFDRAEIAALDLPEPPLVLSENHGQTTSTDSSKVTIELSAATSSGMEGEISHPLEGLTLTVSGGMFNAPQIAYLRVVTTGTGTGHAAPGTDYEVLYTHVVIPAESYFTPVQIPLNNILINGDAIENPDKTLTVELLPTCSPYLKLGSITSSGYTIIDDDEHKIYVEAAQPTLDEGQSMKVKVRMTGELLPTPVTVTLSKGGTSEAEDEDHSPLPTTVTIPAGELEVEFDLDAAPDRILEPEETLEINATATFGIETKTAADTIRIIDTTQNNAANKVIHFITQNAPENTPVTFTASLPDGVSTELPLEITMPANLSSGSLASSSDFNTIFPATVTIGAFESSVDFTVTAASDNRIEPDEIAYFDATATGFTVQQGSFYVIDNQANKQITISFDLSEVSEGNTVTGTVHLPYLTTYALELDLLKDLSSVADDDDFDFQNTKVTFAVLANEASFTLDINSDLLLEPDELLKIGGTYKDFTVVPGTVTIKDETKNQPGLCEFTIEPQAVNVLEGNSVNVKVKLAPGVQSTQAITIDLGNGGGGTADAADYTMPPSVTIDPGNNEATFVLTAAPDMIIEPAEQLQISGNATISGYSTTRYATIDILDATGNDPDNKKIAVNTPLSVTEGSSLPVTFSLPAGITTTDPITIDIAITQVGAGYAENLDFVGGVPPFLVIPAGGNNVTWTAVPATDGVTEGTEHLVLQATTSTGFTVNDNNPVDVEVLDNTSASPATTIEFSTSLSTLSEDGFDIAEITVSLQSGTASSPITITLDKLAGTTATDDDFVFFPEDVIIEAGQSSFTFYMAANADLLLERREVLNLSGIAAGYTFVGTTLYFEDNNSKNISLVLDDPSMSPLVEESSTLRLRVKLDDGILASENMTVNLSRGAGSVASLLATEYAFPASVVIPAGANYVAFDVEAKPDGVIEPADERLELIATADIFGDTRTSAMDVGIVDVTGTIPANKVVTVSGPATVTEGSAVSYTFSLPSGITSAEDIIISLTAGTVTPATVAADFNPAIPSTVTIPAGADHATLTIKAANDNIIEATEKLLLTPSSTGFTFSGNVSLDVIDNSITGAAIAITSSDASVTEGESATITAALEGGLVAGIDITVTISAGSASTADAADHAALVNITIPAESSTGTMTLTTLEDDFLEAAETLVVEGTATGFTVTGTTVTIDDKNGQNAANKIFTITPEATSVTEGGGTKVWIRLPSPQKTQEALTISLQRGSATSAGLLASEYSFDPTVTIPAGGSEVSFDLDIMTDNVIEPLEELEIEASAMVYGTSITASNKVDIVDANDRTITISGPAIVTEGSSATLTFSLPSGITTAEAITINLAPGTATPATDAADFSPALLTSVTIPAGGDHVDYHVNPSTDNILEPTEKLHLIPSATGFTFGSDVTLDILDNDHTGATIALSTSQTTIAEGGTGTTITATLLGGLTAGTDIVINLSRGSSSSSQSSDHSTLNQITIAATQTSGSTTLTAGNDNILERSETLILEGTATGFTVTGTTVTITDATGPKQLTLTPEAT
ncbi:Calx-beta domain-containing protein, partial [Chitinophaga cymbidii]